MKASIFVNLFAKQSRRSALRQSLTAKPTVGFASISFCEGFTSWAPHARPAAALSHRALHSTQVSVQETSPNNNDEKVILLKQAQNYLGVSNLVYLYAEFRQLSYCGYTKTKFSDIDCNQDGRSISGYMLLDILLKERDWVIKRTHDPDNSYRRSNQR